MHVNRQRNALRARREVTLPTLELREAIATARTTPFGRLGTLAVNRTRRRLFRTLRSPEKPQNLLRQPMLSMYRNAFRTSRNSVLRGRPIEDVPDKRGSNYSHSASFKSDS